jgi:hypothetical protein
MRTPVLAGRARFCLLGPGCLPGVVIQLPAIGVADALAVGMPLLVPQVEPGDPLPVGGWVFSSPIGG